LNFLSNHIGEWLGLVPEEGRDEKAHKQAMSRFQAHHITGLKIRFPYVANIFDWNEDCFERSAELDTLTLFYGNGVRISSN
jgi:hypothetical protein